MAYNYSPFFSKISIQGKNQDELSYVFSSGPIEQKKCSVFLFGVFAISSAQEVYQQFIKQTVKNFIDFYQRAPDLLPDQHGDDDINKSEFIFENAIQHIYDKVTSALIEFQEEKKRSIPLDIKKIHCILGCLSDTTLYLSSTGTVLRSYYIYPSMNKQGISRYSIASIVDQQPYEGQSARLFSNIISGSVSVPGGTVCITTLSLLDYLSLEQLKQIITTQKPEGISLSFEKILGKANARNDMSALFIHPTNKGDIHGAFASHATQTAANRSMEVLNSRQRGTDTVMSASRSLRIDTFGIIFGALTRRFVRLMHALEKIFFQPATWKKITLFMSRTVQMLSRSARASTQAIHVLYAHIQRRGLKRAIHERFLNGVGIVKRLRDVCQSFVSHSSTSLRHAFLKLPASSRFILVLSILFITLFLYSLVALGYAKKTKEREASLHALIQSLQQKYSDAEARIIFQNDSGALELLTDIRQVMETIPPSLTQKQRALLDTLKSNLAALELKLNHSVIIDAPDSIAALVALSPIGAVQFSEHGSSLLLSSDTALYLIKKPSTLPKIISLPPLITSSRSAVLASSDSLYLTDTEKSNLYRLTDQSAIKPVPFTKAHTEKSIDLLTLYNGNIYNYDTHSGSIYKHIKQGDGFSSGSQWIRDQSIDLHSVHDIDIDGTVYILKDGNELYQYSNGKPRQIKLPRFEPQLGTLSKIETHAASNLLFLLETQGKRIIVVDKKTRALVAQVSSPAFQNIRDIQLSLETKNLIVLNETSLYRIPLDKIK